MPTSSPCSAPVRAETAPNTRDPPPRASRRADERLSGRTATGVGRPPRSGPSHPAERSPHAPPSGGRHPISATPPCRARSVEGSRPLSLPVTGPATTVRPCPRSAIPSACAMDTQLCDATAPAVTASTAPHRLHGITFWLLSANCCRRRSRSTSGLPMGPQAERVGPGIVRMAQPHGLRGRLRAPPGAPRRSEERRPPDQSPSVRPAVLAPGTARGQRRC